MSFFQSGHGLELDAPSAESLLQIKAMLPSGGHLVAALVLFSSQVGICCLNSNYPLLSLCFLLFLVGGGFIIC